MNSRSTASPASPSPCLQVHHVQDARNDASRILTARRPYRFAPIPVRKDLKDYLLSVYHGDLQDFLKVALDSGTDGVVEHHEVALVFLGVEQKTLHLTASDVGCAVEGTDIEIVPGSHVDSQRTAEVFQLVAVALCGCSRGGLV